MNAPVKISEGDLKAFLELVQVAKQCRECGSQWVGNMFAGFEQRGQMNKTAAGRVLATCDSCIDEWEANFKLREFRFHADEIQRGINEATRRPARRNLFNSLERVLRQMADLASGEHRAKLLIQLDKVRSRRDALEQKMEDAV